MNVLLFIMYLMMANHVLLDRVIQDKSLTMMDHVKTAPIIIDLKTKVKVVDLMCVLSTKS